MADQTSCYRGSNKTWLTKHLVTEAVTQDMADQLVTGTVTLWRPDNRQDTADQLVTWTVTQKHFEGFQPEGYISLYREFPTRRVYLDYIEGFSPEGYISTI